MRGNSVDIIPFLRPWNGAMTGNGHFRMHATGAPALDAAGRAPFFYYYFGYSAGAETV